MANYNKKQRELTNATSIVNTDAFSGGDGGTNSYRYTWDLVKQSIGLTTDALNGGIPVFNSSTRKLDISEVFYIDSSGDLHINTDIFQSGLAYETHAEKLYTTQDVIITRDGAVTGMASTETTGIQAKLYDGTNDGFIGFDNEGIARVGDVGDLVALCGRDEVENKGLLMR